MPSRLLRIGLLVFGALLCAVTAILPVFPKPPADAPRAAVAESRALTVLVFPFENESHIANFDWLGEGLSELTVERLADRGASVLSRRERLSTMEKMGLPDTARLSHATLVKIAGEADADVIIYGRFSSDGKNVTIEARVLRVSPPSLSQPLIQTSSMQDVLRAHARLTWQILCAMDHAKCLPEGTMKDESSFTQPPASLRVDALQDFIQGLSGPDDEARLRSLREASRLEPSWDRPAFELGEIYFERKDCETALPWLSRIPPNRLDGPEAAFDTGVCHLARNDFARADAAFSGLIDRAHSNDSKDRLPEFPEAHNNLGISRLHEGRLADAGAEFERAAALDPEEPDYWVNVGIGKLIEKQPAAAVAPFEHARKIDPEDAEARSLLVSTLEAAGRDSDAAAIRAEIAEEAADASHAVQPHPEANLQDPVALAKLARVSKKFDRTILQPSDAVRATPTAGHTPRKEDPSVGPR